MAPCIPGQQPSIGGRDHLRQGRKIDHLNQGKPQHGNYFNGQESLYIICVCSLIKFKRFKFPCSIRVARSFHPSANQALVVICYFRDAWSVQRARISLLVICMRCWHDWCLILEYHPKVGIEVSSAVWSVRRVMWYLVTYIPSKRLEVSYSVQSRKDHLQQKSTQLTMCEL